MTYKGLNVELLKIYFLIIIIIPVYAFDNNNMQREIIRIRFK